MYTLYEDHLSLKPTGVFIQKQHMAPITANVLHT